MMLCLVIGYTSNDSGVDNAELEVLAIVTMVIELFITLFVVLVLCAIVMSRCNRIEGELET